MWLSNNDQIRTQATAAATATTTMEVTTIEATQVTGNLNKTTTATQTKDLALTLVAVRYVEHKDMAQNDAYNSIPSSQDKTRSRALHLLHGNPEPT